jgi:hypothetical protein
MNDIPLTIVSLDITDFARIKAVHIKPNSSGAVVISGRNAQGKSSVLDAIAQLINGSRHKVPLPVRVGADEANIVAVLGRGGEPELIVKWRTTSSGKKTLVVEDADGIKKSSPASLLTSLFGYLAVDPFAFSEMNEKEQIRTILRATGFDVDAWQAERDKIFNDRTIVNRQVVRLEHHLKSLTKPSPDAPTESVSVTDLLEERKRLAELRGNYEQATTVYEAWRDRAAELRRLLKEAESTCETAVSQMATAARSNPTDEQLQDALSRIETADVLNRQYMDARKFREASSDLETTTIEAKKLSAALIEKDNEIRMAIASSPIGGPLQFVDDELRLNDLPLAVASHAEKLRVGIGVATMLQPEASVVLVKDGSLLDQDSMAAIEQIAQAHGMQVWIERVEPGEGFTIEDGEIQ